MRAVLSRSSVHPEAPGGPVTVAACKVAAKHTDPTLEFGNPFSYSSHSFFCIKFHTCCHRWPHNKARAHGHAGGAAVLPTAFECVGPLGRWEGLWSVCQDCWEQFLCDSDVGSPL